VTERIRIDGLRQFQKAVRDADAALPKQIRLILNEAAQEVIDYAKPRVPRRTGKAAASIKARSSQRAVRIAVGGTKAPYYPWLDFGGEGKRHHKPPPREFIKAGRYLYPGLAARRDEVTAIMARGMTELAKSAGLDVT
jgi:hypothetical protein